MASRTDPTGQTAGPVAAPTSVPRWLTLGSLYLLWAELFQLDAICLWCTAIHVLTVALFGVIAIGTALVDQRD